MHPWIVSWLNVARTASRDRFLTSFWLPLLEKAAARRLSVDRIRCAVPQLCIPSFTRYDVHRITVRQASLPMNPDVIESVGDGQGGDNLVE